MAPPEVPPGDLEEPPERNEPTFRELFVSNARLVGATVLLAAAAYGLWRLLRLVFPDVEWLRGGGA